MFTFNVDFLKVCVSGLLIMPVLDLLNILLFVVCSMIHMTFQEWLYFRLQVTGCYYIENFVL